MISFRVILALAAAIAFVYASPHQNHRYNLVLSTGNHTFDFRGSTKISFTLNGYNYSYLNLTDYGRPTNFTKHVELDFSLQPVENITIEWDYKFLDWPEYLLYRPELIVNHFSIIPVYERRHSGLHETYVDVGHKKRSLGGYQGEIDLEAINQEGQYDNPVSSYYYNSLKNNQQYLNPANYNANPNANQNSPAYNIKNPNNRPSIAAQDAVQTAVQAAIQAAIQNALQNAAQNSANNVAENAAQNAAQNAAIQNAIQNAAQNAAVQSAIQNAVQNAAQNAAIQNAASNNAQNAAQTATQAAAQNAAIQNAIQNAAQNAAQNAIQNAAQNAVQNANYNHRPVDIKNGNVNSINSNSNLNANPVVANPHVNPNANPLVNPNINPNSPSYIANLNKLNSHTADELQVANYKNPGSLHRPLESVSIANPNANLNANPLVNPNINPNSPSYNRPSDVVNANYNPSGLNVNPVLNANPNINALNNLNNLNNLNTLNNLNNRPTDVQVASVNSNSIVIPHANVKPNNPNGNYNGPSNPISNPIANANANLNANLNANINPNSPIQNVNHPVNPNRPVDAHQNANYRPSAVGPSVNAAHNRPDSSRFDSHRPNKPVSPIHHRPFNQERPIRFCPPAGVESIPARTPVVLFRC